MPWLLPTTCVRCSRARTTPPTSTQPLDGSRRSGCRIVAIQEHQRKQTQAFRRSDRFWSRLALPSLPLLAESGLGRLLIGKRLRSLQHGVVPVQLTA